MLPTLFPGDVLTVEATSLNNLRKGDLVLIVRGARAFVHRLISEPSQMSPFETRGDAMAQADPPVGERCLCGRVMEVTRDGRTFLPARRLTAIRRAAGLMLCYCDRLRGWLLALQARRSHSSARSLDSIEVAS
jgi:hypothetical protein